MTSPLTPSQMKQFVEDNLMIREIPYISGPPGIGKSDIVQQVADDLGMLLIDIRLSQMLPEDLTGLPTLDKKAGKSRYIEFDTFPMANDKVPDGYNGWIIFLDELSSASEEVMAAIYSLLLGRRIGGKKIHEKALIVGAGNRAGDSAIARELPDTLITRMMCAEMTVNSKDWLAWAKDPNNKATDDPSGEHIVSFIEKYPDMLLGTVDPNSRGELETYNTPRGWGKTFGIMKRHEKICNEAPKRKPKTDAAGIPITPPSQAGSTSMPISDRIMRMLVAANGAIVAQSFREHYDEALSVPFPWEVAQSPTSVRIPGTTIARAKLTADLAEHFIDTQEQSRDAILVFINRMADTEHSALFVQILVDNLGSTQSDKRLINDVSKRLAVDAINVGDVADGEDDKIPF